MTNRWNKLSKVTLPFFDLVPSEKIQNTCPEESWTPIQGNWPWLKDQWHMRQQTSRCGLLVWDVSVYQWHNISEWGKAHHERLSCQAWPRKPSTTEHYGCEVCDGAKLFAGFQVHHSQDSISCARDSRELMSPNWQTVIPITTKNLRVVQGLQFGSLTGDDSSASLGGFLVTRHLLQSAPRSFLVSSCNFGQKHYQVHVTSKQACTKLTSSC